MTDRAWGSKTTDNQCTLFSHRIDSHDDIAFVVIISIRCKEVFKIIFL